MYTLAAGARAVSSPRAEPQTGRSNVHWNTDKQQVRTFIQFASPVALPDNVAKILGGKKGHVVVSTYCLNYESHEEPREGLSLLTVVYGPHVGGSSARLAPAEASALSQSCIGQRDGDPRPPIRRHVAMRQGRETQANTCLCEVYGVLCW